MGNEEQKKLSEKKLSEKKLNEKKENTKKRASINYELKRSTKERKEFQKFREIVLHYEYYSKLLKLSFKNNKILQILYKPDSSFNDYYRQMFHILEKITYINYQECIRLSEKSHSQNKIDENNNVNEDSKKDLINLNRVKFDLSSANQLNTAKRNTMQNK